MAVFQSNGRGPDFKKRAQIFTLCWQNSFLDFVWYSCVTAAVPGCNGRWLVLPLYSKRVNIVLFLAADFAVNLLKPSSLQRTIKRVLWQHEKKVFSWCLNRRRLTVDLWALCSSPTSCLCLLCVCHTLSSSTPTHQCVTNKYSNYRSEDLCWAGIRTQHIHG